MKYLNSIFCKKLLWVSIIAVLMFLFMYHYSNIKAKGLPNHTNLKLPKIERNNQTEIIYTFEPKFESTGNPYLVITLSFRGNKHNHGTYVALPSEWASQKELYKEIRNLKLLNSKQSIEKCKTCTSNGKLVDYMYKIKHKSGEIISLQYELYQSWDKPVDRSNYFRPLFQKDYFLFSGYTGLIEPKFKNSKKKKIKISIVWKNIPKDWVFADSFGFSQQKQVIEGIGSIYKVRGALYTAGKYRVSSFEVKNRPIYVLDIKEWNFSIDKFVEMTEKIVKTERDFWNDYDFPFFLITMIPTKERQKGTSYGGTALINSFVLYVQKNISVPVTKFSHLLTHELFHIWNGKKMGGNSVTWFKEGFTDYYAYLLSFRANLISAKSFFDTTNDIIKTYYLSDYRNLSQGDARDRFWENERLGKLPYQQGFILANNWNTKIKEESDNKYSLDDFMRELLSKMLIQDREMQNNDIVSSANKYIKQGVDKDVNKVEDGETLIPYKNALGSCFVLKNLEIARFDIGFDYYKSKANKSKVAIGVKTNSNAYKAGLRNGQKIVGTDIYWNKTDKKVGLKILENGKERWIRYYPIGKKEQIPQYVLKEGKNLEKCLSEWFK